MPRIKIRQRIWLLFDPATQTFVGLRWRQPHYVIRYTLGDFATAYQLNSSAAASKILQTLHKYPQYCAFDKTVLQRIAVRRLRQQWLIISKTGVVNESKPRKSKRGKAKK
jgi:hypothetical protein